jgi:endoglucanase
MKSNTMFVGIRWAAVVAAVSVMTFALSACKTTPGASASTKTIRINAGATTPCTDPAGQVWLADQGFADGKTTDRGAMEIAGTKNPAIYRTEHYGMTVFSQPVPNGNYTVRLHFAETFSGVTNKGQRVFSLKIEDKELKDLDVLARSGAPRTAWVETLPVAVTDGKLDITFTPGVQNPEINGIEIIPR